MDTAVHPPETRSATGEIDLYKIGGIAGVAGGILAVIANGLHPRPAPSDLGRTRELLDMVEGYSLWRVDHLAILVALCLGVIAAVALARSLGDPVPNPWARLALAATLVTGAVAAVSFSIDGFVLAGVAEDWAAARGLRRALMLERAETLQYVDLAFFSVSTVGLFGLAQGLFGLAFWRSTSYPRWIGAAALVGGGAGLISGVWMWLSGGLGLGNFIIFFTITSVLFAVWLFAGSLLLLRRSKDPQRTSAS
jgi:hypothetical protein